MPVEAKATPDNVSDALTIQGKTATSEPQLQGVEVCKSSKKLWEKLSPRSR
jgi:hypothetical protein